MRRIAGLLAGSLLFLSVAHAEPARPRIAIIIDDLGYARAAGERAVRLPAPVSVAILPDTPHAAFLAEMAYASGKEILLHQPLQARIATGGPEPGGLRLEMTRSELIATLAANIAAIPHVAGVNTHRGSLLTMHPGHMRWLMDEMERHPTLFFVDSYTTEKSVALSIARENGVPAVKRDVFLDPDAEPATLAREFARLCDIAARQGYAVAIGHPHPATLDFLEANLPALSDDGFELVAVSRIVPAAGPATRQAAAGHQAASR